MILIDEVQLTEKWYMSACEPRRNADNIHVATISFQTTVDLFDLFVYSEFDLIVNCHIPQKKYFISVSTCTSFNFSQRPSTL